MKKYLASMLILPVGLLAVVMVFTTLLVVVKAHAQTPFGFDINRGSFATGPDGTRAEGVITFERTMRRADNLNSTMRIRVWDVKIWDPEDGELKPFPALTGLYGATDKAVEGVFECVTTPVVNEVGEAEDICLPLIEGDIESVYMDLTGNVEASICTNRDFWGRCTDETEDSTNGMVVSEPISEPTATVTRDAPNASTYYYGQVILTISGEIDSFTFATHRVSDGAFDNMVTVTNPCNGSGSCTVRVGYCPLESVTWTVTANTPLGPVSTPIDSYWQLRPNNCVP